MTDQLTIHSNALTQLPYKSKIYILHIALALIYHISRDSQLTDSDICALKILRLVLSLYSAYI